MRRHGFWPLALLWLPTCFAVQAIVRFGPEGALWTDTAMWLQMAARSLAVAAPVGLPLALGCRCLWRLGYRQTAWATGAVLGAATVAAGLYAGLLGPIAIAVCAAILSAPVWIACFWLSRRA